jgi:GT2 family glycosyltransferase
MANIDVGVVILAWNHLNDTLECLESLRKSEKVNPFLVVVDNGSTDGTFETIYSLYKENKVKVIRSERNLGIAGGYNLGLNYLVDLGYDYILITNNDVVVEKHMLFNLISFALRYENAGIVSPKVYHYFDKGKIWMIGARWRRFPPTLKMIAHNVEDSAQYHKPMELDYVPSCCYLLLKDVINKVGFFDESYFFYFDDWDYSKRVRDKGFKIWMNPIAVAWHKVSISTQKQRKPYFWWKQMGYSASRFYRRYCSKHNQILGLGWMVAREILKLEPVRALAILNGVIEERNKNGW